MRKNFLLLIYFDIISLKEENHPLMSVSGLECWVKTDPESIFSLRKYIFHLHYSVLIKLYFSCHTQYRITCGELLQQCVSVFFFKNLWQWIWGCRERCSVFVLFFFSPTFHYVLPNAIVKYILLLYSLCKYI